MAEKLLPYGAIRNSTIVAKIGHGGKDAGANRVVAGKTVTGIKRLTARK